MPSPPPRSSATMLSRRAAGGRPRSAGAAPTTRCAATSNPDGSKICEPMCECRPISRSPAQRDHPAHRLRGVAAGQREAELLVLVRGRDELVGVRLDADRDPDHHRDRVRRRAVLGQPGQPGDLVEGVDDDGADPGLHRGRQLGRRLVRPVQRDPLAAGIRPAAPASVHRPCRRPAPAPRRAASARSRCTGTPFRRSARPWRRRRRRRNPGSGCGSRPRR